jgi:hypothetical protein
VAFPVAAVFMKKVNPRGVLFSSICGFCGTILFYFLESKGILNGIEPGWLRASGLGYILWGMLFAVIGYFLATKDTKMKKITNYKFQITNKFQITMTKITKNYKKRITTIAMGHDINEQSTMADHV